MKKLTKKQLKQWMEDTGLIALNDNNFNNELHLWSLSYAPYSKEYSEGYYITWYYSETQYVLSFNVSDAYTSAYIANKIEKENNTPFYKMVKTQISGVYNSNEHDIYVPYGEISQTNKINYTDGKIVLTILDDFNKEKNIAKTETFLVDFNLLDTMKQLRSAYKAQKTREKAEKERLKNIKKTLKSDFKLAAKHLTDEEKHELLKELL